MIGLEKAVKKIYSVFFSKMYSSNSIIPTYFALKLQYFISTRIWIDFKKPIGYAQKMQWLKAFYRNPLCIKCSDKYQVRDYISKKGYGNYLVDLLGVYNNVDEIDISTLPLSFVFKISTGSGNNIFVFDKNRINFIEIKKFLKKNLEKKPKTSSGETQYLQSKPVILCEPCMTENGVLPEDYKFYCTDGEVIAINYGPKRKIGDPCKVYLLDMNYNDISAEKTMKDTTFVPPKNYNTMISIAKELSKGFPFVRVDFYEIGEKMYFSELTFTPSGGTGKYLSKEADFFLGEKIKLSKDFFSKSGKWIY